VTGGRKLTSNNVRIILRLKEFLRKLEHLEGVNVDLVITDYRMPGMNGVEFIRVLRLRTSTPRILIDIISKHAD
jgi:CheY-like chemotaxis protein